MQMRGTGQTRTSRASGPLHSQIVFQRTRNPGVAADHSKWIVAIATGCSLALGFMTNRWGDRVVVAVIGCPDYRPYEVRRFYANLTPNQPLS